MPAWCSSPCGIALETLHADLNLTWQVISAMSASATVHLTAKDASWQHMALRGKVQGCHIGAYRWLGLLVLVGEAGPC